MVKSFASFVAAATLGTVGAATCAATTYAFDERDRLQVKDTFLQQAAAATGHDIVAFAQVLASAPGVETIKIVPLSADVVELYARVQITRGASEASAKTAPFFVYEVVLRTPVGWRIASIVPVSAQ